MSFGPYRSPDAGEDSSGNLVDLERARAQFRPPDPAASHGQSAATGGGNNSPPPRGPSAAERKLAARRRNESVKLVSSGLSGLGIGLVSIGFVQPLLKDAVLLIRESHWGWVGIGLALHAFSHFIIHTELQRED